MEFCHSTIYGSISLLFLPLNFYLHPIIPPSFNLGLYVAPEGKFFSRMFSCKVLKKIEGKNIYYRIHLIRPLKRLWTCPVVPSDSDRSRLKFLFLQLDISISIPQIHRKSCNYVNGAIHTVRLRTCHRTIKIWRVFPIY